MEFSRKAVIFIALYSACQSVLYILLSILSILSYYCLAETAFTLSPTIYMIHLMYFRSHHCGNGINWNSLGVANFNHVQADRPDVPSPVARTFIISILYLSLYSSLLLACVSIVGSRNHIPKRHIFSCICIVSPFILIMLSLFIVDNFAAAYYSVDYVRSSSAAGAMTVLEIRNRENVRPILENVNLNILMFPPALMMYTSLKYFVMFVMNILVTILIIPAVWNNLNRNKDEKLKNEKMSILRNSQEMNRCNQPIFTVE